MDNKPNTRDNWIASLKKHPQLTDKHRAFLTQAYDELVGAGEDGESAIAKLLDKYFEKKPKSEAKANVQSFNRESLRTCLEHPKCGLSSGAVRLAMNRFDAIAKEEGTEFAWTTVYDYYGHTVPEMALTESFGSAIHYRLPQTKMGQTIEDSLTDINSAHKVETNPQLRYESAVSNITDRYARLMKGLQATLCSQFTNGQTLNVFNQADYEQVLRTLPKIAKQKLVENESFGAWKKTNNLTRLEFEQEI